jgi:two-component system phosphate regulon sensor histidine kinase PhoR
MEKGKIHDIIIKNLPMGYSVVDEKGTIIDFNHAAEEITGYSKTEVIGKSHLDMLHSTPDKDACPLFKHALIRRKETIATEASIKKKNGDIITIGVTAFPLVNDIGNFIGGVELFRDITESKRLQRERKDILSMFAHDMKNPIVTSGGFLSRLLSGKLGAFTDKQEDYLELIMDELNALEGLITSFLQFSRLESKEYKPVLGPFNIGIAIEKNIEVLKVEADKKKVKICFKYPEEMSPTINADAEMITRVITNLLDNAIIYSGTGGTVTVSISDLGKDILVQIIDTGMGIPEKHLPYIFDPFYRASRNSKGSGLGLSIVKTIVEASALTCQSMKNEMKLELQTIFLFQIITTLTGAIPARRRHWRH